MASQILGFLVRSQSSGNHSRVPQLSKKIYSYSLYLGKSDWNLNQNSWTRVKAMNDRSIIDFELIAILYLRAHYIGSVDPVKAPSLEQYST